MNPFAANKLLRFPERIGEWMRTGATTGPIVVDFDLTNRCPHNCPRCPGQWRRDPNAEMSRKDALTWLGQFRDIGTLAVSFGGGGDPLAHPYAVDIFQAAANMGLSVGVITNAAVLNPVMAERIVECATWVRVSLDAATAQTFSRVHGVPEVHFARVIDNIRELANVPNRKATVGVGFLTDEAVREEILPAARLVSDLGVDYIQYRPYNGDMTDVTNEIWSAQGSGDGNFKVLASWPKYDEMREGYVKPYRTCQVHHFAAVVTAFGNLHICCDLKTPNGQYGSLKERSLKEWWQSGERERVVERIDLATCPPLCRGNCHNILLENIGSPMTHEEFL